MLNTRALLLATTLGTVLQVAMVSAGHLHKSIAGLFAVGGMGFSLLAGLAYAMWSRGSSSASRAVGGLIAGAVCAFIGILVSYGLGDVPGSLLVMGTISSAVTGALGGWLGKFVFARTTVAAVCGLFLGASSIARAQTGSTSPVIGDTSPIVAEALIEASVEAVWNAWANGAELRSWLAPHADIDLRLHGLLRTNYSPKGSLGDSNTIENTILSLDPHRMLSIQVSKAPQSFPFPNAIKQMWTVMYFERLAPDRTKVRVVGLGFQDNAESQRMRAFFKQGNALTLQQLERHFHAKR